MLRKEGPQATQTLQTLTTLAPDNAHHWAYLEFVYLDRWQGNAQAALVEAEHLQPDLPNLKLLQTGNAVMGLKLPKAIRLAQSL